MDEINRVARVMVDAEPSADLEARIRARLDETPVMAPRRSWGTWQVASGLAAAATIALIVWVQEPASPKPEAKAGPESTAVLQSDGVPVVASVGISPSRTLPSLRHSSGGRRAESTRALSAEELAWMDRRIPALDPVIALEMDRLSTESIQPDRLAITPLIMTTLPTTSVEVERIINR